MGLLFDMSKIFAESVQHFRRFLNTNKQFNSINNYLIFSILIYSLNMDKKIEFLFIYLDPIFDWSVWSDVR